MGSRGALGDMTTDTATTVMELDVLVEGVLAQLKRRLSIDDSKINESQVLEVESLQHEEEFKQGLVRLGYRKEPVIKKERQ